MAPSIAPRRDGFHQSVKVRAMNGVDEWGASDHCRLLIEIAGE